MGEAVTPGAAERAMALFSDVAGGNWHLPRADFSDTMKSALDDDGLARAWTQVAAQVGEYHGMGEPVVTQTADCTSVTVPLVFDACVMRGCVSFDAQGKVAGLRFLFEVDGHGGNVTGNLVLRCSDGHLYLASRDALLWRSIHFGTKQFRPCPVDHKWRVAVFVDPRELTRAELEQAQSYRI